MMHCGVLLGIAHMQHLQMYAREYTVEASVSSRYRVIITRTKLVCTGPVTE